MKTYKWNIPVITVVFVLMTTGCVKLWQETLDIKTYMIETERELPVVENPLADKLWIDTVSVLPPFNVRNLILRESDVEFSTSYYTELLMSPSENFRNEFYVWMDESKIFKEVSIVQRSEMSHRLIVNVVEFYGDKVNRTAVLKLKVTLFDERTKGLNILMNEEYVQRVRVDNEEDVKVDKLIRAYNAALTQILTECEKDLMEALNQPRP